MRVYECHDGQSCASLRHLCCRKAEFRQTVEAVPSSTYTVRVVTQGIPDDPGDRREYLIIKMQVAVPQERWWR